MRTKNIFFALAAMLLLVVGCGKDKKLSDTSWKCDLEFDATSLLLDDDDEDNERMASLLEMFGGKVMANIDLTMDFKNDKSGMFTMNFSIPALAAIIGSAANETETTPFNYTFDGERGTLTLMDEDGDNASTEFIYSSKENTITIPLDFFGDDSDVIEMSRFLKTDNFVFTEVKK